MTTETYEALKLQVMRHEGKRLLPYKDTVGKLTIGYGRNLTDRGISDDEAGFLLENDLNACVADCESFPWFAGLDPVRQRVLVDLRFNLGAAGIRRFTRTLQCVQAGDFAGAADGLLASKWAAQVKTRATRLAAMMRTGQDV